MSCPDCFKGAVHDFAEPTGKIETIHGIQTYVAGGSEPSRSKSAIIYLSDAFSLRLVNNKLLADKYASVTGCRVLFPDVVPGGGLDPVLLSRMETATSPMDKFSLGGMLQKGGAYMALVPTFIPFMISAAPEKAYDKILAYARAVKADLPPGGKLGVVGFCWGGWGSTKLCSEPALAGGEERLIDAHFHGHPSNIHKTPEMVVEAIMKYQVPYAAAIAERDFQFDEKAARKTEARVISSVGASGEGSYNYEFKVYKGCTHGFCVRAQDDTANMIGYHEALNQGTKWFNKYLNEQKE